MRILLYLAFSLSLFSFPTSIYGQTQEEIFEGKVLQIIKQEKRSSEDFNYTYQKIKLLVTSGSLHGQTITIENGEYASADNQTYNVGDKLIVSKEPDLDNQSKFYIRDYVRRDGLLILFIIFASLTILIGRIRGVLSLIGMGLSFLVIIFFILPRIIAGDNPVFIAIVGSVMIIPITFSLSHGLNPKTAIAVFGTLITLIITGLLAAIFVSITHLTGFATEEAGFLQFDLGSKINMKGILLAGIIVATLGILDDITISQAGIVAELKSANPKLKLNELFTRAMNIGRDHISSLVNTLVLVYTGASLPLMLLFAYNPRPFNEVINYEIIADEVVRTLVGSIGLIVAVPITTFLAAIYFSKTHKARPEV